MGPGVALFAKSSLPSRSRDAASYFCVAHDLRIHRWNELGAAAFERQHDIGEQFSLGWVYGQHTLTKNGSPLHPTTVASLYSSEMISPAATSRGMTRRELAEATILDGANAVASHLQKKRIASRIRKDSNRRRDDSR